jgi:dTDP-4-amino-4,6-dideoxygalactose transaminase
MLKIPFNRPFVIGKELYYMSQSVLSGKIAGDGTFTQKCHALLEEKFDAKKILLTTSCTAALEMATILFDVGPDDEVILPPFTFVSTANAFYLRGAKPVFVDIRADTLNIDETKIEAAISQKTKAIVPVHYAGVACDMDPILKIAQKHEIFVIEDAAQGLNAKYKDRYLGTFGDLGAYSFHETKNCICGEGGAIVINNEKFIERAEIVREKGTNRSKFFRGEVDRYTWVDMGSSYLPADLLAAFLYAQLENMDLIDAHRRKIFSQYYHSLKPLADDGLLRLPIVPSDCQPCGHLFYIIVSDEKTRDRLIDHLRSKGIGAVFHYIPLHLSKIGRALGYTSGQFPVTESLSSRLIRLPLYYDLTTEEQNLVIKSVKNFFKKL